MKISGKKLWQSNVSKDVSILFALRMFERLQSKLQCFENELDNQQHMLECKQLKRK